MKKPSAKELEQAANQLLYGEKTEPKRMRGHQYRLPKNRASSAACDDCGKPRSIGSAKVCRACYRNRAAKKAEVTVEHDTYLSLLLHEGFDPDIHTKRGE